MAIHLDHVLVPSRNRVASAEFLAQLLGVLWAVSGVGPFSPVYVDDGLTLDFEETSEPFPKLHFCFRVDQAEFDAILERITAAGLQYRGSLHGPVDFKVNTVLTVSYAREAKSP